MPSSRRCNGVTIVLCAVLWASGSAWAASAQAPPQRTVEEFSYSGKGNSRKIKKGYPLAHFLQDFNGRDQGGTLCLGCQNHQGKTIRIEDFDIVTEKREIGVIAGRSVIELHTKFTAKPGRGLLRPDSEAAPGEADDAAVWKSILVQGDGELYHEVYLIQALGEYVLPFTWSRLLELGSEHILATNDPMEGNGAQCTDGYWSLDAAGPQPLDFRRIDKALASRAPKGSLVGQTRCWALDMSEQTIHTYTQKPNVCRACGYTAKIAAHFHLKGPEAIPDKVEVKLLDDDN